MLRKAVLLIVCMVMVGMTAATQLDESLAYAKSALFQIVEEMDLSNSNITLPVNAAVPTVNVTLPLPPINFTMPVVPDFSDKEKAAALLATNKAVNAVNVAQSLVDSAFKARQAATVASAEAVDAVKKSKFFKKAVDGLDLKFKGVEAELRNAQTNAKDAAANVGRLNGQIKNSQRTIADNNKLAADRKSTLAILEAQLKTIDAAGIQATKNEITSVTAALKQAESVVASHTAALKDYEAQLKTATETLQRHSAAVKVKSDLLARVKAESQDKVSCSFRPIPDWNP